MVRVVIVDDSKLIQSVLNTLFEKDGRFQVVGIAENPHDARQVIKDTDPDVITLDVEMPKMNGITFLRNLMRLRPTPVVMISTLTAKGATVTMEALELGALDFVEKPADLAHSMESYQQDICDKVYAASKVSRLKLLDLQQRLLSDNAASAAQTAAPSVAQVAQSSQPAAPKGIVAAHRICAIGGSTGGLEALSHLLKHVSFCQRETIVVALHLPAGFTASYANRLNSLLPIDVKEGEQGEVLRQGCVYIAPGGRHMAVKKRQSNYVIVLDDGEPVNRHKPSVDVLFDSVASEIGASAIGVILTGMGRDGAVGLNNMAQAGCVTYAQDEATSVVWGMPGAAYELGAVSDRNVLPLTELSQRVTAYYRK
ncbi:protein-glutamate methylesterase/protein-glutamine glutaminase [Aestuariibacter salexigens]|uniref:protein-glutamate methylesterase/protein-glutamine glutaminase n=1 Tax=Aestuariibacter salexigens TaxID=226010 RepID=UPI0003F6BFF6|nr:chemotaxis response regulator protein-glutamate methylesterase [Aestuariibacter salexigens]